MTRYLDGGRKRFLEYVQLAAQDGDDTAGAFWEVFTDLKLREQMTCSLDDVCAAADIKPSDLMAVVVSTGMEHAIDTGELVAAALHPKVVSQMGKSALRIDGDYADVAQKDRIAFLQHQKFVPIPRNASMNVQVNANASSNSQAAAAAKSEPSVPRFMDDVNALRAPQERVQQVLSEGDVVEKVEW